MVLVMASLWDIPTESAIDCSDSEPQCYYCYEQDGILPPPLGFEILV